MEMTHTYMIHYDDDDYYDHGENKYTHFFSMATPCYDKYKE